MPETKPLQEVLPYLPPALRGELAALGAQYLKGLEELRLRRGLPVALRFGDSEAFLSAKKPGAVTTRAEAARLLSDGEMEQLIMLLSGSSFYALDEELRRGYITLPGGHRAGLCGKAVLEHGQIRTMKEISSVNLRIARPLRGNGALLLPYLWGTGDLPHSTLIVSPPGAGKTTLLRDLAGLLSLGTSGFRPLNVGVVDERSEIAAMVKGKAQMPLGLRCDVLDACPKAEGMMLMIRSMAPQVLICDEIGRPEDATAIAEAANAGIRVIASAHGANREEILARPVLAQLLANHFFRLIVILSRRKGPGTIEEIWNGHTLEKKEREGGPC